LKLFNEIAFAPTLELEKYRSSRCGIYLCTFTVEIKAKFSMLTNVFFRVQLGGTGK
jgi:hypothetical protein